MEDHVRKKQGGVDLWDPAVWAFPLVAVVTAAMSCTLLVWHSDAAVPVTIGLDLVVVVGMEAVAQSAPALPTKERVRQGSVGYLGMWTFWVAYTSAWPAQLRVPVLAS